MPSSSIKYQQLPTNDKDDKSDDYAADKDDFYSSGQDYSSIFSYNRPDSFKSFYTYGFTAPNNEEFDACRVSKSRIRFSFIISLRLIIHKLRCSKCFIKQIPRQN